MNLFALMKRGPQIKRWSNIPHHTEVCTVGDRGLEQHLRCVKECAATVMKSVRNGTVQDVPQAERNKEVRVEEKFMVSGTNVTRMNTTV